MAPATNAHFSDFFQSGPGYTDGWIRKADSRDGACGLRGVIVASVCAVVVTARLRYAVFVISEDNQHAT